MHMRLNESHLDFTAVRPTMSRTWFQTSPAVAIAYITTILVVLVNSNTPNGMIFELNGAERVQTGTVREFSKTSPSLATYHQPLATAFHNGSHGYSTPGTYPRTGFHFFRNAVTSSDPIRTVDSNSPCFWL